LVSFRAGTDYNSSANLQATQILFNGSYIIGLQAAKNYASFQETKAELTKEDVVYNVVQAYQLAAVAKTNLSFVDSITSLTEEMVNKQSVFFDLGLMKSEDMDQLNYSLLTAKQSQMAANLQYQNALTLLKYSMGYPVDEQISIAQSVDALISKKTIGPRNIKSNLSYELIKKQIRLSELDLKNKQFSNLPNLNAYYQQSYTAYRNEFNFYDADKQWFLQSSWGLQLNIPVFSGGQRHALTQQAKIRLMKDQNSLMQMEQTLKMQETQAKNNLLNAQSKLELQKQNVVLARKIYQNATASEQIGEGTSIVVTQKYNQLIVAQTQYVGATIDLFQAQLELDKIYNTILKN
jgi:outer membrane protein TolC